MFWNDYSKSWAVPRTQSTSEEIPKISTSQKTPTDVKKSSRKSPTDVKKSTQKSYQKGGYTCPVCKQALEEYSYTKDGQSKVMLRCSNPQARSDPKHKEVAYFNTQKGSDGV